MTKDEALRIALEALEKAHHAMQTDMAQDQIEEAITAIKEALAQQSNISELKEKTANHNVDCLCADCSMLDDLEDAQPEQEPVAWQREIGTGIRFMPHGILPSVGKETGWTPLYTTPPQRKPLTDEQIAETWQQYNPLHGIASFARAIEAAHGIKGDA